MFLDMNRAAINRVVISIPLQKQTQGILERLVVEIHSHRPADIGRQKQVQAILDRHALQQVANLGIFDIQILDDDGIRNREWLKRLSEHCCAQSKQQSKDKLALAYKIHVRKIRKKIFYSLNGLAKHGVLINNLVVQVVRDFPCRITLYAFIYISRVGRNLFVLKHASNLGT